MRTEGTGLQRGSARITVRTRLVVAVGVALLVIGLVTWILIGRARTPVVGSRAVTTPSPSVTASIPTLGLKDDYATRHMGEVVPSTPPLSFKDDYATRHLGD